MEMGYKYFSCFFMILVALFDIIWHMHTSRGSHPDVAFAAGIPTPMAMSPGRLEQNGPHSVFMGRSTPGKLEQGLLRKEIH